MPVPTVGQTVTWNIAGSSPATTMRGTAVVVAAGYALVAGAIVPAEPQTGMIRWPVCVEVSDILTAS